MKLFSIVLGLLMLTGGQVQAAHQASPNLKCATKEIFSKGLKDRYNEDMVATGLLFNGNILNVFASPSGSWTIVFTSPKGISCLLSTGTNWSAVTKRGKPL